MTKVRPALIIFQGGATSFNEASHPSPLQEFVFDGQAAATLDLLARASHSGIFERAFLVTEQSALAHLALEEVAGRHHGALPLTIVSGAVSQDVPFHFGQTLRTVCAEHGLERVVYVGGGAMPLGAESDIHDLALSVSGAGECVVANSLYSADVAAFYPASALDRIALPATDNDLAWLLHFRGGLPFAPLPRTLTTQLDIDTPTDLATLWWASRAGPLRDTLGPHLSELLGRVPNQLPLLADAVGRACKVMATRRAEVLVAGRVSSWVWRRLETNLPSQTRIISEERGMRASGREERGEVRSLLGLYSDAAGIPGLIRAIEQTCNAAFLDTRVLFAHHRFKPPAWDRFASDALMPDTISDPWVRDFTEAVMASSVPIVLGGHSLVSGGVWALSERVRGGGSSAL